ncbi:trehalose-6-phosphate synthase [uncultured Azohydromonas sp.]|jgi:Trehalose-6-phosphate synthase|uniref:alpha,alpha-trehalose-phosphate synthase (UDP-forming) n=1 Tax=uncultured Azohydromonas sp. TaxID=487342 RepID=UPI002639CDF1|nr:trehalose-6-phosphate synthase [uncultured Azohydromonas sp.]
MSRLVVVSNRVADPRRAAAGGLAVALGDALAASGGLWFGADAEVVEDGSAAAGQVRTHRAGPVTLASVVLGRTDHDQYYRGYANGVLWPVFHYRLDLAQFDAGHLDGYRRVNRLFAQQLRSLLRPDDVVWVHDYHLIPLAAELRALGCQQRIGFFLHIPLPPPLILAALPAHDWLVRALFAYDLVGLQSQADLNHLHRYLAVEARAEVLSDNLFGAFNRVLRAGAFPIGIDVAEFEAMTQAAPAQKTLATLREQYAQRRLLVGVDRLDYSKGLPQRLRAMRTLLERHPETRSSATLVQVAAPSREEVDAYGDIRRELEGLAGAINGDFGELDWMPIRYLHRTVARNRIPGLYRASRAALVTPLRDGMNLVAKEFIAAQDPADPGVLVLSRFAGAAEQLTDALLVNPYDTEATAEAIRRALQMPLQERQVRHERLLAEIRCHDVHWWRQSFLDTLMETNA